MGVPETDPLSQLSLPPGFRFYPTDEELLVQYLCRKVAGQNFSLEIIGEIDLYKFDPWVLPSKALFGEKEWYFFSPRDRKYPNGSRPNRVAGSGYWKATGTDKVITTEGRRVGIKKALVFYVGKAPKGTKTNWIMHEYRLYEPSRKNGSAKLDDWVLCRIYKKNTSEQKPILGVSNREQSHGSSSPSSQFDDVLDSLPEINEQFLNLPRMNSSKLNLQNLMTSGNLDWASLAGITLPPELLPAGGLAQAQLNPNYSACSNSYVLAIPPPCQGRSEEVQTGSRRQRIDNSGFYQLGTDAFTQGFGTSTEPFGVRYPTHEVLFGFRQ